MAIGDVILDLLALATAGLITSESGLSLSEARQVFSQVSQP